MSNHTLGMSAFPRPAGEFHGEQEGLSKRELFAAMAMQGIVTGTKGDAFYNHVATDAVNYADALLKALSDEEVNKHV